MHRCTILGPGDIPSIFRIYQHIGFQTVNVHFRLTAVHLDSVYLIGNCQIKHTAVRHIHQLSNLLFYNLIRQCRRYKQHLFHRVSYSVIVADTDSHLSFMLTAVHITIYDKIQTSSLVYPKDTNIMFLIIFPDIHAFLAPETENSRQIVFNLIVAPQFSLLHKTDDISCLICLI